MRKKIITVAATLLLLGLLSMVEQLSVERLTSEAMEKTQEILFLLARNEPEQGLERARAMDAWWDEEAPNAEMIINHAATDDVLPEAYWRSMGKAAATPEDEWVRELDRPLAVLLENFPLLGGNRITPLLTGDEAFPKMLDAIREAAKAESNNEIVGTPAQIADQLQHVFESGACDGFIVAPTYFPGMIEQFCRSVVPELQRRGIFRREYTGRTLRENLLAA